MKSYAAILDGDHVTWVGDRPHARGPIEVTVTACSDSELTAGVDLAAVVERLRAAGPVTSFGDPQRWQREQRIDRPLPGRE